MPFRLRADKRVNDREWVDRHNYVQMNSWVPASLRDDVNEYCLRHGLTRPEFLARALNTLEDREAGIGGQR
jgi:hypothetical protein